MTDLKKVIKIKVLEMTKLSRKNSIVDNKKASNQSFLYFLHEEGRFDEPSFLELYHYIKTLDILTLHELRDLYFIQNQILRHLSYHFDDNDLSQISNLPKDYWQWLALLDEAIIEASHTLIG